MKKHARLHLSSQIRSGTQLRLTKTSRIFFVDGFGEFDGFDGFSDRNKIGRIIISRKKLISFNSFNSSREVCNQSVIKVLQSVTKCVKYMLFHIVLS